MLESLPPPPPPPRHPPVPSRPAASSASTTTSYDDSSASAGRRIGERVRGAFEAVHGVGEALRGNINSALDGLGDGIADRPQGSVESRTSATSQESVAQKGMTELKQGISAMKGESSTTATTPNRTV